MVHQSIRYALNRDSLIWDSGNLGEITLRAKSKMSFVASSFAVGVVTACAASMHIQFELQYRKELFHLKELMRKEEELDARGYQYVSHPSC